MRKIRLLSITDVKTIHELQQLISAETNIELVAATSNWIEGIKKAEALQPDVILLDYFWPVYGSDEGPIILPGLQVKPWRNDFINICKQLNQVSSVSKIVVLLPISWTGNDFKQLRKVNFIHNFSPKQLIREDLVRSVFDAMASLKKIAKDIRYCPLLDIIGQEIEMSSLETIEADIRKTLGDLFPKESVLISTIQPMAIAKYGILDLEFQVPNPILEANYQNGISLLGELGFVNQPEQYPNIHQIDLDFAFLADLADDPFCLIELAQDISKNQTFLKLFLTGQPVLEARNLEQMSAQTARRFFDNLTLPSDYFPQTFRVVDACFTNASFVWFHKHFYL